jgi:hypothetical protein
VSEGHSMASPTLIATQASAAEQRGAICPSEV